MTSQPISIYDIRALDQLRAEYRLDPRVLRMLKTALFKKWLSIEEALALIPESVRPSFAKRLRIGPLMIDQRRDSAVDGATKLLFRTSEGLPLESVLLLAGTGRTTLCISSQVGCAAGCTFCATGKMEIVRDLSASEILDQVRQAGSLAASQGRRVRNIVFMGMGEPLFNEAHVCAAIETLISPRYYHHSPKRILLSTVGVPEAMLRVARRFPEVNLALSLHTTRQELREQLIGPARRWPLDVLRNCVKSLNQIQPQPVMIEYLMLAGLNDLETHARELVAWVGNLRVHLNLIPYNQIDCNLGDGIPHLEGTDRKNRDHFAALLRREGLQTTIRYSLGSDIGAACGQLAGSS